MYIFHIIAFKEGRWSKENFIIMTDLRKTSGCKMVERTDGLDITHASLVLEEIAKLHANTWAYKQKNGLRLLSSKYDCFEDQMYTKQQMIDSFKPLMDSICDNTLKVIEEAIGNEHQAYKSFKELLAADTMDLLRRCLLPEGIDEDLQERYLRVKPKDDGKSEKGMSISI